MLLLITILHVQVAILSILCLVESFMSLSNLDYDYHTGMLSYHGRKQYRTTVSMKLPQEIHIVKYNLPYSLIQSA